MSTASTADVVIVGGGLEGCSAAYALTQLGITDVAIVERGTVGSGMTAKSSGIVRCHYGVPSLAAMATDSLELFENAEEIFGSDIGFRQIGYVVGVGPRNVEPFRASLAAQQAIGVLTEEVDVAVIADLWPQADLSDFAAFAYEKRGGYGDAYMTAQAFAGAARAAGVRLHQQSPAVEVTVDGDRATGVRLADGSTISADTVVVATGAWTRGFLAPLGLDIPIRVHREEIVMVAPGIDLGAVPVFSDLVSLQYVRPEVGGDILFGNSDLRQISDADPDGYSNRVTEATRDVAVDKIGTRFPDLTEAAVSGGYAGCYDVTPDWNPIISRMPLDGLVLAAGFSGHGFKISPAVGRLIADLVVDGRSRDPRIPERDFRFERFARNEPLTTAFPYVGAGEMR